MDPRTVRGWAERAGKSPADAIETDQWRSLMDLSLARVSAQVASGKMRVRDMAVVAGIAARNLRELAVRPPADPDDDVVGRWIDATYPSQRDRHLALEIVTVALQVHLRLIAESESEPDRQSSPDYIAGDPEAATRLDAVLTDYLAHVEDLEAELAVLTGWLDFERTRGTVLRERATVLRSSGMSFLDAATFAREISDDLVPPPLPATWDMDWMDR